MSTIGELARLSRIPLEIVLTGPGRGARFGNFSDYVQLGGERIWLRVFRGEIVKAEAPPDVNSLLNRKWIAGSGPVGLEAAAMLKAAADL